MGKDVMVACDCSSSDQMCSFLEKFIGRKPYVKIGMEPGSETHLRADESKANIV